MEEFPSTRRKTCDRRKASAALGWTWGPWSLTLPIDPSAHGLSVTPRMSCKGAIQPCLHHDGCTPYSIKHLCLFRLRLTFSLQYPPFASLGDRKGSRSHQHCPHLAEGIRQRLQRVPAMIRNLRHLDQGSEAVGRRGIGLL